MLISNQTGVFNEGINEAWIEGVFASGRAKIGLMEIEKQYDDTVNNEKWILENVIISEIDFGGGDYNSDDLNEISITLTYDIARPETTDPLEDTFFESGKEKAKQKKNKIKEEAKKSSKSRTVGKIKFKRK